VIRVPPAFTGESRKATRTPGKSGPIDARAVALAAIREGVDSLPIAFLDEQAHEIRGGSRGSAADHERTYHHQLRTISCA
jgi:hypothetical protein